MKDGQWCTANSYGEIFDGEKFDTKEEAIKDGKEGYGNDTFWVGQIKTVDTIDYIDIDCLIDQAKCEADDDGGESAEDFLMNVKEEEKKELKKIIAEYFESKGHGPDFCRIINSEKIVGVK